MKIIDLNANNTDVVRHAADLLVAGFKEHSPEAWPDLDAAMSEVEALLPGERINRVAVDDDGQLLGWIGGGSEYNGHTWELHPLVVRPDRQGEGIGRALVADFEERVREQGGVTIFLGTDDEDDMTSLAGIDLYPDLLGHLARITNRRGHPYEFYQKQGFAIVGVIPDANGRGKPDILMAKRVGGPK